MRIRGQMRVKEDGCWLSERWVCEVAAGLLLVGPDSDWVRLEGRGYGGILRGRRIIVRGNILEAGDG